MNEMEVNEFPVGIQFRNKPIVIPLARISVGIGNEVVFS